MLDTHNLNAHHKTFFQQWLRNPKEMGSLFPSSSALAGAMAAQTADLGNGTVVELGAGTGVITKALLGTGIYANQLLVVEKNPSMSDTLRQRFPNLRVVQDDVTRLSRIVRDEGDGQNIKAIVSGLPMLLFDRRKQYVILRQAFSTLVSGGSFIQFTYGPKQPVSRTVLLRLGIKAKRVAFVWYNTPPAFVWRLELSPTSVTHERYVSGGF